MRQLMVAALVAAAQPASAAQEVALRISSEFGGDSGLFATGSSRNLLQAELGYAHTVKSFRRAELWLEGSWTIGERHDRLFATYPASVIAQQLTVGVRATIPIRPWLVPQLRVGVGALLGTLRISGLTAGSIEETSAAFTSYALAGIQFLLPRPWMRLEGKRGMTAGVVVEGGYCYSTDLGYSLSPASSPDKIQLPSAATDLGTVSLSGALLRIGIAMRL